ncbi:MAG TPA: succinate dehydrogenase cytochrome b subunit [Blastocatellia bacterium]|nr:succinate dehydrogenase cytochrome b subunit [Blastocatellia bacterium]
MSNVTRFYKSSLGKKYVMALTGFALFGFVIAHMAGNLQIFLGPESINAYAAFLKSKPGLLWAARIGLLAVAILHITAAVQLVRINRRARPVGYNDNKVVASSLAQRTIFMSGLIILAFIIYHLLHFTFGATNPDYLQYHDPLGRHDVYRMMIAGFSNIWVSIFYIIAMGLLCLHLSHGVSSMFQSLGLRRRAITRSLNLFARAMALLIFTGNVAIVVAVLTGLVK